MIKPLTLKSASIWVPLVPPGHLGAPLGDDVVSGPSTFLSWPPLTVFSGLCYTGFSVGLDRMDWYLVFPGMGESLGVYDPTLKC